MKKTRVLLWILLNTSGTYADSMDESLTTESHTSLRATFQARDRLPTAKTAKKMTAEGLQNCKNWRIYAQKKFFAQISKLPECEKDNGICGAKRNCVSYWATEVTFKNSLTLVDRTRSFSGPKSEQSMDACLKWTRDVEKQEGVRYLWSTCYYDEQLEEGESVTGKVESLLDSLLEPKSRLLKHHLAQAQTPDVIFKQYTASYLDVHFHFKLQKDNAEATDPEFKNSLSACESWRTRSFKKFAAQSTGIDACRSAGSLCLPSYPQTCHFSQIARISWKVPRTIYSIQKKFSSSNYYGPAFEACGRWLMEEQEFAPSETIHVNCSESGSSSGVGKNIYYVSGSINQIEGIEG